MNTVRHFFSLAQKHFLLWGLVLLLLVAWIAVSVLRLFFGEAWYQKQQSAFIQTTADKARADIPKFFYPGGGGSTPFISVWNGIRYVLENDFLFGKPRSYFSSFAEGSKEHEANRVFPDLYKMESPLALKDGKLTLQIQEIEHEESFINGFELLRVIHALRSEIFVDSEYRKFYAFDKEELSKSFVSPSAVTSKSGEDVSHLANIQNLWEEPKEHKVFNKGDYIDVKFSGLTPGAKYLFALKSYHRVWIMGEDPSVLEQARYTVSRFIQSNVLTRAAQGSLAVLGLWLAKDVLPLLPFAPVLGLSTPVKDSDGEQSAWSGPGSTGGTSGGSAYCLPILYKTESGAYCHVSTIEPRGWRYSSEMVALPREAVLNSGEMTLRVLSTECHHVAFAGLVKEPSEVPCKVENLKVKNAYHQRLKETVTHSLQYQKGKYVHTIPGDVIDLEFALPEAALAEGERETYLVRAGGFYTYLTPRSKKIAGNWEERISEEARGRLEMLRKTAPRIVRRVS